MSTDQSRSTIDLSPIDSLVQLIVTRCQPTSIWLFGSRAKGAAKPDSDWDLLVVLPESIPFEDQDAYVNARELRRLTGVNAEIVSCSANDFLAASSIPNTLAYEVATTGVAVYER